MTPEIKWYYNELTKRKNQLLRDNLLDPDWYHMYWFGRAKTLTPLEREMAGIDSDLLRIMIMEQLSLN